MNAKRKTNYALLNNVDHGALKVITDRSARFGDDIMQSLLFPFEFRSAQACYPILFQQDAEGNFSPRALFGFQQGENLFLDESGWGARYIPAMVRREPFLIGFQKSASQGEVAGTRVLSIDMDHPRVSAEQGEPLFQPLGGRTPFLENMADLLETVYLGIEHGRAFVAALREHDLLETMTLEIQLNDGSRNQLLGFHCLNEEKIQRLPGTVLGELNDKGFLMPIFMVLASMGNLRALVERKNALLPAGMTTGANVGQSAAGGGDNDSGDA